ncbi:hypothetical protein [Paraburkholderia sp.]|uniref:hypothetical protein n=1 Tax=Paraburkholderia sp. TaxID=1926495 RepID=UPI0039E4BDB8
MADNEEETARSQLKEDQRDFNEHFRTDFDFRKPTRSELDDVLSFVSNHLRGLKQTAPDGRPPLASERPPPSGEGCSDPISVTLNGPLSAVVKSPIIASGKSLLIAGSDGGVAVVDTASGDVGSFEWFGLTGAIAIVVSKDGIDADTNNMPTLFGNAQPFEYSANPASNNAFDLAARGVSEANEAECFTQYERDLDLCNALASAMGGFRGLALCKQQAFVNYQQCRGY